MTNAELDCARATEAVRLRLLPGLWQHETVIAARLAREGWTPPVAVDPDIAEAWDLVGWRGWSDSHELVLSAIKRGRALAAAEVKPGLVWVKHDGENYCPIAREQYVLTASPRGYKTNFAQQMFWQHVTHYAVITPPAEDK